MKSTLLTLFGFLSLAMGGIGIFLPIWPTTPFVILATICFAGNPRMLARLTKIKFFRDHVNNYKQRTGLSKGNVIASLAFLWLTLCLSAAMMQKAWAYGVLGCVGIAVTLHILVISRAKAPNHRQTKKDGR